LEQTKRLTNRQKGDDLEDAVDQVLQMLTDQSIVQHYVLATKWDYPDVAVLDSKDRWWLLECKNLATKWLKDYPTKSGGYLWVHNTNWVRKNILSKRWEGGKYDGRLWKGATGTEYRDRITITVSNPIPALITTLLMYDGEALGLVRGFFGKNIVEIVYPTWSGQSGWAMELVKGLRRLFTS
jgi:hypothetical protein